MTMSDADRTRRSYAAVTDDDLRRLAELGAEHDARFRSEHPAWATTLLTTCLAQGAAQHRVHGDKGVKDFDVWLFYAMPPGRNGGQFPWNRNTVHVDFGLSAHGRQEHTDAERANPAYDVASWERFDGRRVDLLVRAIKTHRCGPVVAVQAWLTKGSQYRSRPDKDPPSAWWLSRAPVVDLSSERFGDVIWDTCAEP